MSNYRVEILDTSKELTKKEQIMAADFSDAISLDSATQDGAITLDIDYYVCCRVHNEHAKDNKEYIKYVIVDKTGDKYQTGSQTFIDALNRILDLMVGCDEPYKIKAYRRPSKNYVGKDFITCSIV